VKIEPVSILAICR